MALVDGGLVVNEYWPACCNRLTCVSHVWPAAHSHLQILNHFHVGSVGLLLNVSPLPKPEYCRLLSDDQHDDCDGLRLLVPPLPGWKHVVE
jgi:hypothetical protein